MTYRNLVILAAGGSAALLLGALAFQYLGGLAPCKLCFWQRYPHVAAIVIGAAALALPSRLLAGLGACAALTTAALGVYHTGVERKFWAGPTSCTGTGAGIDKDNLLSTDGPIGLVMCDEVAWEMLGLSMASWNALASVAFAALWIMALRRA